MIFYAFVVICLLFFKLTFSKNSFRIISRVSNSLDPAQGRHYVGLDLGPNVSPDLGPNFLQCQQMAVETASKEKVKTINWNWFLRYHMGLVATKPVFRIYVKARLKPFSPASETS